MKVLLVNPSQTFYDDSVGFNSYFPIGLLSVAAKVRSVAKVKIHDCLVENCQRTVVKNVIRYGCSLEYSVSVIGEFYPDIIGITCPFSSQLKNSVELAAAIKKEFPDCLIVLGGPDVSVRGVEIMKKYPVFDIGVVGEGEYPFEAIVKSYRDNNKDFHLTKGIIFREGNKVKYSGSASLIQNLNELSFPAYDLVNFKTYYQSPYLYEKRSLLRGKSISVITSRGCPYGCIFCSIHLHMGRFFRAQSADYVIKHLKMLYKNYGARNVHFEDDNISYDMQRFENILDGIIKEKIKIRWDTPNGVRVDKLNLMLLKKMKQAGCCKLTVAVESGNQDVLNKIVHKQLNLEQVEKVAEWCKEIKLPLSAFYIIGFPGETTLTMRETIDYSLSLYRKFLVEPMMLVATPLYGTEMYDICKKKGYFATKISEDKLSQGTQLNGQHLIKTKDFDGKDIDIIARHYQKQFYYLKHMIGGLSKFKLVNNSNQKFVSNLFIKEYPDFSLPFWYGLFLIFHGFVLLYHTKNE